MVSETFSSLFKFSKMLKLSKNFVKPSRVLRIFRWRSKCSECVFYNNIEGCLNCHEVYLRCMKFQWFY